MLFAKACEMFVLDVTMRAWSHADQHGRKTLQVFLLLISYNFHVYFNDDSSLTHNLSLYIIYKSNYLYGIMYIFSEMTSSQHLKMMKFLIF